MPLTAVGEDESGGPPWSPEIGALVRTIRYSDDVRFVLAQTAADHPRVRLEVARWFPPALPDPAGRPSTRPSMPDEVADELLADPDRKVRETAIRRTSNLRALGTWAVRCEELGIRVATGAEDDPREAADYSTAVAASRHLRSLVADSETVGSIPPAWHDVVRDTDKPALMATYMGQPALHDDLRVNVHLRALMAQPDLSSRLYADRSLSEPMRRALLAWASGSPPPAERPRLPPTVPEYLWDIEDAAGVIPFLTNPDPAMRLAAVSWFSPGTVDPTRAMPVAVLQDLLSREDDSWIIRVALTRCSSPVILLGVLDGQPPSPLGVADAVRRLAELGLDAEIRLRGDRLSDRERAAWYAATRDSAVLAEAVAGGAHTEVLLGNPSLPAALVERLELDPRELAQHPNAPDSLVRRSGVRLADFAVGACPGRATAAHATLVDHLETPAHRLGAAGADLDELGWRGGDLAHVIECVLPTVEDVLTRPDLTRAEVQDCARLVREAQDVTSVYRGPGQIGQHPTHVEWRGELVHLRDHADRALPPDLAEAFRQELDDTLDP